MTTSDIPGFPQHLASVPYSSPASRLRTVDIWLPEKANATKSDSDGLWLIYLHGGAWRDPTQDSRCVLPTLSHLSTTYPQTLNQLSGIASLNYRLSPYENHPTDPSKNDEERSAKHPQHVQDVISGLHFLAREYGVKRWIGVGHSCGATLLLQVVGGIPSSNQIKEEGKIPGPEGLILLEGIYHFPLLLKNHVPPSTPQHIADIYKEFLAGPFGAFSEETYLAASPVSGTYSVEHWPEGKLLVICHSYADELVERAQRDVMCVALDRQGWSIVMEVGDAEDEVKGGDGGTRRVLNVRDLQGGHDEIWEDGKQIAQLIAEVVQRLEK